MVRKRTTSRGHAIARWLSNAALFLSFLLSPELTQRPQHFQSYQTELALPVREASRNMVAYPRSYCRTDVKEIDSLNSFVYIQLHHSSSFSAKLKNARLIVSPVPTVRYLQFQSTLSGSDEDLFLSLKG